MVLKAIKNSLNKIVRKDILVKKFYEKKKKKKTNLNKKIIWKFSEVQKFPEVPKFGYFPKVMLKINIFRIWNTFDPSAICIQCNVLHDATIIVM